MAKVFVSHSTKDREFAEREIIPALSSRGLETWYSKDDIKTADQWDRSILQGLKSCEWFLVIMSPNAEQSEWVKDEVLWAIQHRPGRIVPVLSSRCEPREINLRLARIQYVNYLDPTQGRAQLLDAFDPNRPDSNGEPTMPTWTPERAPTLSETMLGYIFLIIVCPAISIAVILALRWLLAFPARWIGVQDIGDVGVWTFLGGVVGLALTAYCVKLEVLKSRGPTASGSDGTKDR